MAQKPTKPLFTARFTLVNTSPYPADQIMGIFKADLIKAGFALYQTPSVRSYTAKYRITKEGPYPDDDAKSVYETMFITGPAGKELSLGKDITNDPMGSRPILEKRKPVVTAITWNIGGNGKTAQSLADVLWATRRSRVHNADTYTGLGWTPVVAPWQDAPVKLSPYPDRPAIPKALLPTPKPKPKPIKPKPKPIIKPPVPGPVIPPPEPSLFSRWQVWAILAAIGAYVASEQ